MSERVSVYSASRVSHKKDQMIKKNTHISSNSNSNKEL